MLTVPLARSTVDAAPRMGCSIYSACIPCALLVHPICRWGVLTVHPILVMHDPMEHGIMHPNLVMHDPNLVMHDPNLVMHDPNLVMHDPMEHGIMHPMGSPYPGSQGSS